MLVEKLYYQQKSGNNSVDGSIADLLIRDGTMGQHKISIWSCSKMINGKFEDASVSIDITEVMS